MPGTRKPNPEDYNKPFPARLRYLMQERGITQQALADAVGKSRQAISQYQTGTSCPDSETLADITRALNVCSDYLLGITAEPSPSIDAQGLARVTKLSTKSLHRLVDRDLFYRQALDAILSADALDGLLDAIKAARLDIDRAGMYIDDTSEVSPSRWNRDALLGISAVKAARSDVIDAGNELFREIVNDSALLERYEEKRSSIMEREAERLKLEDAERESAE